MLILSKPAFLATNALILISAAIVMSISSYLVSLGNVGVDEKATLIISALTVVFFLGSFLLDALAGTVLLLNLVFSHLWIVAVLFNHGAFVHSRSHLGPVAGAFCYITFFLIFFNVLFDWHARFRSPRIAV